MQYPTITKLLLLSFLAILTACSVSELSKDTSFSASETIIPTPTITTDSTLMPAVTESPVDSSSLVPTEETILTSQMMATVQPTNPPSMIKLRDDCPVLISTNQQPLWTTGSILFESDSSVWAIPATSLTPQMIFSVGSEEGFSKTYFENGSRKLLISDFLRAEGNFYFVYDLADQSQIKISIESVVPPIPLDGQYVTWLPDDRVKFLTNLERVEGVVEKRTFQVIDLTTKQTKTVSEVLDLPDYGFYRNGMYFGFASVDPTNKIVLYTTMSESDSSGLRLILRELGSGNLLWEQEDSFWATWPIPDVQWENDGSRFLFSSEISGYSEPFGFLSIKSNGEAELLPPQPFPMTDQWHQINNFSRSPDGRYIYYHLGATPGREYETGPGVIVDSSTLQAGNICELNSEFYGGKWISETLFLYRVKIRDGFMSLRLLDVLTWTTQDLVELVARPYYDNSFGWTPVDISNP